MLRSAQYIEDNNIIYDGKETNKLGKKAQVGFDVTCKAVYKCFYPGIVTKTKTFVPDYRLMPVEHIKYPYSDHIGRELEFDGWFLPKGSYIIEVNEGCHFNKNDTGKYIQRSSLNRSFVTIISSIWDPGFTTEDESGIHNPTLRLNVDTEEGFYLEKDARVAQLLVITSEDTELYGGKDSQFQGGKRTSTK